MAGILNDLSTPALVAAIEANQIEYWRTCCPHLPGVELHDGPDTIWFVTDIPFAPFNEVLLAQLSADSVHARIEEALAPFRARRVPALWSVGPSTRPADLGRCLEAHGLNSVGGMPGMAVELAALGDDAPMPPGLAIERVGDAPTLERWRQAFAQGFGIPDFASRAFFGLCVGVGFGDRVPFRHYVGLLGGEPVASSTVFFGAGVAAIYHVGTIASARRQGIGAAMTLAPLRDARAIGYRVGTLYASQMGLNIYRKLGFEAYYELTQYELPGVPND